MALRLNYVTDGRKDRVICWVIWLIFHIKILSGGLCRLHMASKNALCCSPSFPFVWKILLKYSIYVYIYNTYIHIHPLILMNVENIPHFPRLNLFKIFQLGPEFFQSCPGRIKTTKQIFSYPENLLFKNAFQEILWESYK